MSAISTIQKNGVSVRLNDGTKQGVIQTVGVSLGTLNNSAFDADKALNIVDSLEPCLTKEVVRVEHTQMAYLSRA